jgi:hypothetical protein
MLLVASDYAEQWSLYLVRNQPAVAVRNADWIAKLAALVSTSTPELPFTD